MFLTKSNLRTWVPALFTVLWAAFVPGTAAGADGIEWAASFELAMEQARAEKKIVMVDFFTHWCHWCKVLDEKTYSDPQVIEASRTLVNVKVNAGSHPELAGKYGVTAYPTVLFLRPDGTVRLNLRGFKPPERFLPQLQSARAIGGQLLATRNRVEDRPQEPLLRRELIDLLALDGRWEEAAEHCQVLLQGDADLDRVDLELDYLLFRQRAGADVRKDLEAWVRAHGAHSRGVEARFRLAVAQETAGQSDDARRGFEGVIERAGETWFGVTARAHLQAAKKPGPKGT